MNDASGFGIQVRLIASKTFPAGITLTEFADDADPLDIPEIQVGDKAMNVNGNLVTWSKATPTDVNVSAIPGSGDDSNLAVLLDANRPQPGRRPARDVITLVVTYPDGSVATASPGRIMAGPPAKSVQSSGRMKGNVYKFTFEAMTRVRAK